MSILPVLKPGSRVAVIGAGISGLSAAWLLRDTFAVTLFEADARAGGHADTQLIRIDGADVAVDTGFIVYNVRNYPNLIGLFDTLGVKTQPTDMSFGVSIDGGRLEYAGGDKVSQLLAQKRNVVRPRFWSMTSDILRFYREAPAMLDDPGYETLGDWLDRRRYGRPFVEDHILPMGAAIWSASVDGMRAFPMRHFVRFFQNHGLLQLRDRPLWRTVTGGSRHYVARIIGDLGHSSQLGRGAAGVERHESEVTVRLSDGSSGAFDHVVFACHADQTLRLIDRPTKAERDVLSAFRFQDNTAVLHTDASLMPKRRAAWAAWNYLAEGDADHGREVSVTYWMNTLQGLQTPVPVLVSLNALTPPDPAKMLATRRYRHPQFDAAAMQAQARLDLIQGIDRLWFAGAWTRWGFHEDGIASALRIARGLGVEPPWSARERGVAAA